MAQQKKKEGEYSQGYGKKNRTKWIVIYLAAAILIYGLVYALVIKKNQTTGSGSSQSIY